MHVQYMYMCTHAPCINNSMETVQMHIEYNNIINLPLVPPLVQLVGHP